MPELLEDNLLLLTLSVISSLASVLVYLIKKKIETYAVKESFIILGMEDMTARASWLPLVSKIRTSFGKPFYLNYGNLNTKLPWVIK